MLPVALEVEAGADDAFGLRLARVAVANSGVGAGEEVSVEIDSSARAGSAVPEGMVIGAVIAAPLLPSHVERSGKAAGAVRSSAATAVVAIAGDESAEKVVEAASGAGSEETTGGRGVTGSADAVKSVDGAVPGEGSAAPAAVACAHAPRAGPDFGVCCSNASVKVAEGSSGAGATAVALAPVADAIVGRKPSDVLPEYAFIISCSWRRRSGLACRGPGASSGWVR